MTDYWDDVVKLFNISAYILKSKAYKHVDLHFTGPDNDGRAAYDGTMRAMVKAVEERKLQGNHDISTALESVLKKYVAELPVRRPLNVYIFTNTTWPEIADATPANDNVLRILAGNYHVRKHLRIQVVEFGHKATEIASRYMRWWSLRPEL